MLFKGSGRPKRSSLVARQTPNPHWMTIFPIFTLAMPSHETNMVKCAKTDDTLLVFGKAANQDAVKNWYLCGITKADGFLHTNLGSFFTEQGARKQYTLKQGLEWTGGDSIDDYC